MNLKKWLECYRVNWQERVMAYQPMKRVFAACILLACLGGCHPKTIDASTDAKSKQSIQEVRASLPPAQQADFDQALREMTGQAFRQAMTEQGDTLKDFQQTLNGKSAAEIIAAGKQVKEQRLVEQAREDKMRREKAEAQARTEIAELRAKQAKAESDRLELAKFVVQRSRFHKEKRDYSIQPTLDLTLINQTKTPVARAYFEGTLSTPGRSVPWLKDAFNYAVPGGIEPGETQNLSLAPNQFGPWGTVNAPPDAVFTVRVTRVDGPDGEAAFSADAFTASDSARLKALVKEYPAP